jgi:hypothetical protein
MYVDQLRSLSGQPWSFYFLIGSEHTREGTDVNASVRERKKARWGVWEVLPFAQLLAHGPLVPRPVLTQMCPFPDTEYPSGQQPPRIHRPLAGGGSARPPEYNVYTVGQ